MRILRYGALRLLFSLLLLASSPFALAQQTLGGLTGTVTDSSGAVLAGAKVQLTGDSNGIELKTTSQHNGVYQFQNLPVGTYTLLFTQSGFDAERVPAVPVQENRTGTINASLKVGVATTTIEVHEAPLLDETDATNGYVLDSEQIQETPLATGSFTHLALLAPGVSGELLAGIGTNAGLGNAPIWATRARNTSLASWKRRAFRSRQCADLGQWTTRHQQRLQRRWRRCHQPLQREVFLGGPVAALRLQYWPGLFCSRSIPD